MGAIIAYWKDTGSPGTSDKERRDGGEQLGRRLRQTVLGNNPRNEVYDVLYGAAGDARFLLRFEYRDSDGNAKWETITQGIVSKPGNDQIKIDFNKTDIKKLTLTVRSDGRDASKNHRMDVVIPEKAEILGFSYLKPIAGDVDAIVVDPNPAGADIENGASYLTAFKLLSRCK